MLCCNLFCSVYSLTQFEHKVPYYYRLTYILNRAGIKVTNSVRNSFYFVGKIWNAGKYAKELWHIFTHAYVRYRGKFAYNVNTRNPKYERQTARHSARACILSGLPNLHRIQAFLQVQTFIGLSAFIILVCLSCILHWTSICSDLIAGNIMNKINFQDSSVL